MKTTAENKRTVLEKYFELVTAHRNKLPVRSLSSPQELADKNLKTCFLLEGSG